MDLRKLAELNRSLFYTFNGREIILDEVLNDSFIAKNTRCKTVKEFIEKSGFDVVHLHDFKGIATDKLDNYVKSISKFGSWKEMLAKAAQIVAESHQK